MPDVLAVIENPEAAPPEDDEFSQAFAQLSVANDAARGGEAAPKPVPEMKVESSEPVAEEPLSPEAQKVEAAPEPPAPEPPKPQPSQLTNEEMARIAAISQQVAKAQQPAPQPQVQQPQQVSPYNEEETAIINDYMNEYPEIARAEALSRRKDIFDAVQYVLREVSKAVGPTIAETQRLAQRTHAGDLQQLIPDFQLTREQAIEWTMKQPDYLQPAYFHVIQQGTPQQVADFTRRYRESQGASQPAPTSVAALTNGVAAAAPRVQETPAQRRAVAALAPVSTKRSGISADGLESLNDFDGAFERYAAQMDQARLKR
jgi:hypothetical protein